MKNVFFASVTVAVFGLAGCSAVNGVTNAASSAASAAGSAASGAVNAAAGAANAATSTLKPGEEVKITYAPPPVAPAGSGPGATPVGAAGTGVASGSGNTAAAAEACTADGHTVIQASGAGFCQIAADGTGYTLDTYLNFRG